MLAACKAIPAIAAAIAAGTFIYTPIDYQSITGYNTGNPLLGPETAKSYTFGLVFTPTALRGFTATLDYYDIKIDQAVGTVDYPTQISNCLLAGTPTACSAVFRSPATGKLTRIDSVSINVATISTAGIDLTAKYRMEMPASVGGMLGIGLTWGHLDKLDQVNGPGAPVTHYKGQLGSGSAVAQTGGPANRATLNLDYDGHGLNAGWTVRYLSAMKDQVDPNNVSSFQLPFNSVPAYTYHDLHLGYTLEGKPKATLYGGVRNVFNKQPPFLPGGMASEITGTMSNPDNYDIIGRQWYAGVEVKL